MSTIRLRNNQDLHISSSWDHVGSGMKVKEARSFQEDMCYSANELVNISIIEDTTYRESSKHLRQGNSQDPCMDPKSRTNMEIGVETNSLLLSQLDKLRSTRTELVLAKSAKNSGGKLLSAGAKGFQGIYEQSLLETEAIQDSLIKAKASGLESTEIVSHNRGIVNKTLNRNSEDLLLATFLDNIINMSDVFPWCSFNWIPKICNNVAVNLAIFYE
ncbi:hypothetical protein ACH5RR_001005 [Cinchona calisaya]|uniref:RNase H type-1 domain-containing protein n=1 Tax=Cinchona calisaya TaxID=153742 RepID=A0ABD3B2E4_9GENT